MDRREFWGKFIWVLGLLLLLGCVRPAASVEAAPSPALQPGSVSVEAPGPQAPVQVVVTAVPTPTPTPSPTPSPTPMPTPTPTPTPTPAPFAAAALPTDRRPARYLTASQTEGLYFWAEKGLYLAYGQVGNDAVGFYPADESGYVVPGSAPVEEARLVPLYTPADPPKKEGEKLLVLYLPNQSVVSFHGENGEWVEDRIMICSSGAGKNATPTGHYKITDRYEYKLLGSKEEETLCYGFRACRFNNGRLFHSVPISYDAGHDRKKAHALTKMRNYEKLGRTASHGCVRLTVIDAKYIYDLSATDTVNVWVTKNQGPTPTKPPEISWSSPYTNRKGYGWDPTDPYPGNPYHTATPSPDA